MGSPQSRSLLRDFEPFLSSHMASSRDHPAATTAGNYYLPGRPPIYLEPSITHQRDLHSLNCMLDILFLIVQHIRRHPLHTEPMPNQTYFTDDRAYNILYQYRRDTMLLDRLVDSLATARRLLQFVPGQPGTISHRSLRTHSTRDGSHSSSFSTQSHVAIDTIQPLLLPTTTHTTRRRSPLSPPLDWPSYIHQSTSRTQPIPSQHPQQPQSCQGSLPLPRHPHQLAHVLPTRAPPAAPLYGATAADRAFSSLASVGHFATAYDPYLSLTDTSRRARRKQELSRFS